jgi:hypothetical protein
MSLSGFRLDWDVLVPYLALRGEEEAESFIPPVIFES